MARSFDNSNDRDWFWQIIDQTVSSNHEDQLSALKQVLSGLSSKELAEFRYLYTSAIDTAYRWDVWGAAYLMMGGCSDDSFDYFRDWMISLGRGPYEAILASPDALSHYAPENAENAEFELLRYVADGILQKQTPAKGLLSFFSKKKGKDVILNHPPGPAEPSGEDFDFDDEQQLAQRYPQLWKRFGW